MPWLGSRTTKFALETPLELLMQLGTNCMTPGFYIGTPPAAHRSPARAYPSCPPTCMTSTCSHLPARSARSAEAQRKEVKALLQNKSKIVLAQVSLHAVHVVHAPHAVLTFPDSLSAAHLLHCSPHSPSATCAQGACGYHPARPATGK